MTKRSKFEQAQRAAQGARVKEIEAAWLGSLPSDQAKAFAAAVEVARNRPPAGPPVNMAPGTRPNPPRPGHEPKPPKEERNRRPSRD
jgi:hypothetical protein